MLGLEEVGSDGRRKVASFEVAAVEVLGDLMKSECLMFYAL